jgi:hypothetical protein
VTGCLPADVSGDEHRARAADPSAREVPVLRAFDCQRFAGGYHSDGLPEV